MNWKKLESENQINEIIIESFSQTVLIFKHSTRCSISDSAKNRLERQWIEEKSNNAIIYYLDLIAFRSVSNAISEKFDIEHQSPQVLVIKNEKCIYNASHLNIAFNPIVPFF
ncbi:MAG: bacillithiol system redox-active protein YtxJ [Cytophagales bacterium]|nr:MAG: bacillithiol system redox-active protein YtxJ [Cytophagales bacterium]